MEFSEQDLLLILLIVLIIYLILTLPTEQTVAIISSLVLIFLYTESKTKKKDNMRSNPQSRNKYGNIQTARDINPIKQIPYRGQMYGPVDNSDLVNAEFDEEEMVYYGNNMGESRYRNNISGRGYGVDEQLVRMQQNISDKNKRAIDGAVRSTKNKFSIYFEDELAQNEQREWWSNENKDFEMMDRPYV